MDARTKKIKEIKEVEGLYLPSLERGQLFVTC